MVLTGNERLLNGRLFSSTSISRQAVLMVLQYAATGIFFRDVTSYTWLALKLPCVISMLINGYF